MASGYRKSLAGAVLAMGLAWVSPAAAQERGAQAATAAWRDIMQLPRRDFDPSAFGNNVLRVPRDLKTHRFTYEYRTPKEPKHVVIYDMMREKQVLEKFQAYLAPVYLPNDVKLELAGCDGRVNAQFWQNVVTVCYEYLEWIWRNTPRMTMFGLAPHDAMNGPTVDVFLHEAGHAILQLLDIPLLGSEEDAADYIATFLILQFSEADARRLIMGASFIFGKEALKEQEEAPELASLAGRHALPAQRYFNRLCMAYGKSPVLYADAIERGMLTPQRAQHCAYEYAYISDAFRRLISPYLDPELTKDVQARGWFEFESPFADVKPNPLRQPPEPSAKR